MQDLSDLLPGGPVNVLVPTSQQGGNQIVSNDNAMTAPGSQPASPATSLTGQVLDHDPPMMEVSKPPSVKPAYTTNFESAPVSPTHMHPQGQAPSPVDYTDPKNGVDAGPDSPHPGSDKPRSIQGPPWNSSNGTSGRWKNTPSAGSARAQS